MSVEPGMKKRLAAVAAMMILAGHVFAAGENQAIEAPPPPEVLSSGEPLEPEVTIRRTDKEVIYEYRQGGKLVLVRVQPVAGPPYHFVDRDGDGTLDYRPGEPVRNNINQWVIKRW